jgi:hypothetical protein
MTVTRVLIALVPSGVIAAGNYVVATRLDPGGACMTCLAWLVAGPLVLGVALAFLLPRASVPPAAKPEVTAAERSDAAALGLLGVLQEEGRLVDFLQEDLSGYADAQIGGAVRGIHESCRKALRARLALEPVLRGTEGETVTVEAGFDPGAIRLTGNVQGAPPFRGVLRHGGWRVTQATLPERRGQDPRVLAPAEVEIP